MSAKGGDKSDKVKEVTTLVEFNKILGENTLVVVDFTATWCGPCKTISPKFKAMSEEYESVLFVKVDVDEAAEVSEKCGISAMPTFQFYKNGEKVEEIVGASDEKLRAMIVKRKDM